jgi:hypothetical protein
MYLGLEREGGVKGGKERGRNGGKEAGYFPCV